MNLNISDTKVSVTLDFYNKLIDDMENFGFKDVLFLFFEPIRLFFQKILVYFLFFCYNSNRGDL